METTDLATRNDDKCTVVIIPDRMRIYERSEFAMSISMPVGDMICSFLRDMPTDGLILFVDGIEIPSEKWYIVYPKKNSIIVLTHKLSGGGGGGGKDVVQVALMIGALVITQGFAAGGPWAFMGQQLTVVGQTLFLVGAAYLVSTMNSGAPGDSGFGEIKQTSSFGWNAMTVQRQGTPLPLIFGTAKTHGNIIACWTELDEDTEGTSELLYALISLGMGPVSDITDLRINDQPIDDFTDVSYEIKKGTIDQTAISLWSDLKVETRWMRPIKHGTPVTCVTPDTGDFHDFDIVLRFPKGVYHAEGGGYKEHSIGVKIEVSVHDADSWTTIFDDDITRDTSGAYWRSWLCSDAKAVVLGTKYDIKVSKTSADETDGTYGDDVVLQGVRRIYEDGFTYPRQAVVAIKALANEALQGSFDFSCVVDGLICPVSDGTSWTYAHSSNPAWVQAWLILRPVLSGSGPYTLERLDGLAANRVNQTSLKELADFCDEEISDGEGGTDKRIEFNGIFEEEKSVWDAVVEVNKYARSDPVWDATTFRVVTDKERSVSSACSMGNVRNYKYKIIRKQGRAGTLELEYQNAANGYQMSVCSVYNSNSGDVKDVAIEQVRGVTKECQLWHYGNYRLLQNRYILGEHSWELPIEGLTFEVGDVIRFEHDVINYGDVGSGTQEYNTGGRVENVEFSSGKDIITLDRDIRDALDIGTTYELTLRHQDGSASVCTIDSWNVAAPVTYTALTMDGGFDGHAQKHDMWAIGKIGYSSIKVQISHIERVGVDHVRVRAFPYVPEIYAGDDEDPWIALEAVEEAVARRIPITRTPSVIELNARIPKDVVGLASREQVRWSNISWGDNDPTGGKVSWSPTQSGQPMLLEYQGNVYQIAADNTDNKYIYWDINSSTVFLNTNTKATATAVGMKLICINNDGAARPLSGNDSQDGDSLADGSVVEEVIADNATHIEEYESDTGPTSLTKEVETTVLSATIVSAGRPVSVSAYVAISTEEDTNPVTADVNVYWGTTLVGEILGVEVPIDGGGAGWGTAIGVITDLEGTTGSGSQTFTMKVEAHDYDCQAQSMTMRLSEWNGK